MMEASDNKRWALRRMRLRRSDGSIYLDRWGFMTPFGGMYLHHITAPDPGQDPHDHPWWFASLVLKGHYTELIAESRESKFWWTSFRTQTHRRWSRHAVRLDQCHRIVLCAPNTWTLVLFGRRVRGWGFYTQDGFVPHTEYKREARELTTERGTDSK